VTVAPAPALQAAGVSPRRICAKTGRSILPPDRISPARLIAQHPDAVFTVEGLSPLFEQWPQFNLVQADLDEYLEAHPIEFDPEETSGKSAVLNRHREPEVESAEVEAAPVPMPDEIETAVQRRIKADQTLANARVALTTATYAERDARGRLAVAVTAFQQGLTPVTPQELRNQFVREQQELRRAAAAGEIPAPPRRGIGKSMVDRIASYGRGGSPARGDYRRGAYGAQSKGAPNFDPKRGPVANGG